MSVLFMSSSNQTMSNNLPPPVPPAAGSAPNLQQTGKRVSSANASQKPNNRTQSYEELLVSKYLEQIQQTEMKPANLKQIKRLELESPYLQKLSHSNLLQTLLIPTQRTGSQININSNRSNRSVSRTNSMLASRPTSGMPPDVSASQHLHLFNSRDKPSSNMGSAKQYSSRNNSINNSNPSLHLSLRKERPSSAPLDRGMASQTIRSGGKHKSNDLSKQPYMIKALAYRNGGRQNSAHIAARNIIEFLEIATDKLQCPRAARRLFLENGDEIKHESQFMKNTVVYVSCGEDFDDPFLKTKKLVDQRRSVVWTADGVHFLGNDSGNYQVDANERSQYTSAKPPRNNRFSQGRQTKRITVFENGTEYNPTMALFEPIGVKKSDESYEKVEKNLLQDFYEECKDRLKMTSMVRAAYNWLGHPVRSIHDIPKLDKCLQTFVNDSEYSPVWVSRGEGFDSRGALGFITDLIKEVRDTRKDLLSDRKKLLKTLDSLKQEQMNSTSIQKTTQQRIYETNESISKLQDDVDELNQALTNLEAVRDEIKSIYESQANSYFSSLYSHIKAIDTNSKIFGGDASKGIRLKIFLNGSDEPATTTYFNQKESLMAKSDHVGMHNLLNQITRIIHNSNRSAPATFTRIFNERGEEILSTKVLKYDDSIWVSQGENWKSFQTMTLSMPVDMVLAVRMQDSLDSSRQRQFEHSQTIITETGTEITDEANTNHTEADPDDEFEVEDARSFFSRGNSKPKPTAKKPAEIKQSSSANTTSSTLLSNLKIYRDELNVQKVKEYNKPECWDLIDGFELERKLSSNALPASSIGMLTNAREIDAKKTPLRCLQCRQDKNIILCPQLKLQQKSNPSVTPASQAFSGPPKNDAGSIWFTNFQIWKFNKAGFIYNSFFPKLCLALNTAVSIQLDLHLKKPLKQQQQQQPNSSNFFDDEFQIPSKNEIVTKHGHAVVLSSRQLTEDSNFRDRDQQWAFNLNGNIYSKAFEGKQLVLTSVDMLLRELNNASNQGSGSIIEKYDLRINENHATLSNQDSNHFNNPSMGSLSIHDYVVIILEPFDNGPMSRFASSQRWAIKQENSRSIGEWRLSELATPEWHKLAYTWPIDEKENLIKHFSWPISGFLIPGAPPLRTLEGCIENQRTRLRVVKNGCLDLSTAVTVSRIDNKNLMKQYIHCTNVSYRQFEFDIFLDTCTSSLNLPNAARRIFDETGKEHFDLSQLGQDQLIYVSSGDPWIPPKLIRMEQERKLLLANLSDDLGKIAHFNKLKTCDHFVIETSNSTLQDGVKLTVGQCCLSVKQIERIKKGESIQTVIELEDLDEEIIVQPTKKTAHEMAHERADATRKKQKPWDVVVNRSTEGLFGDQGKVLKSDRSRDSSAESVSKATKPNSGNSNSNGDLEKEVEVNQSSSLINLRDSMISLKSYDNDLREKFKPRPKKAQKNVKLASQKFIYSKSNGYIYSMENQNLVFGVADAENNLNELYLMRKNEDNLNQRWVFKSNGTIASKTRPNLVLTVKLPSLESADVDLTDKLEDIEQKANEKFILSDSSIILQPYIDSENGNAHQKWSIDEKIGFIKAFASDKVNIEVTAANKANICTNYVVEGQEIVQPGYLCEYPVEEEASANQQNSSPSQKILKIYICNACAKGTRGKFKLLKLTRPEKFCCYMGNSKDKSLTQFTGFKYLTGKIILSTAESENTFKKWFSTFSKLRVNTNAKSVLNELSAAKTQQMVKLFAYKNGDGRLKKGELLIGSSITNILDLATKKLELRGAARRIYTEDGTLILDIQDLVTWCIDYYRKEFGRKDSFDNRSETLSIASAKNKQVKIDHRPSNLLDRVDFGQYGHGSASKKESTLSESVTKSMDLAAKMISVEKEKPFKGPSKRELDRMHEEYTKKNYLDPRKVLRWPIEVWISCGEAFVLPSTVAKNETQKIIQRENIDKAEHELEKQAHALRQMTGRRLAGMNLGKFRSDAKDGHWTEATYEEQVKKAEVNQLKSFVEEMKNPNKNNQSAASSKIKISTNLYGNHPITKRVRIYVNGHSPEKAQHCWASSIPELNEAAKVKLNLTKPIKFFFTEEGNIISRFEDIVRDQLVCVSTGREFISPEQRLKEIEIKANWARIKKTQGLDATNLKVESVPNPIVNVDPFGPAQQHSKPLLALPAPSSRSTASGGPSSANRGSQRSEKTESSSKSDHFSIKINSTKKDLRDVKINEDEHDDDDDIDISTKSISEKSKKSSSKGKKKRSALASASSADFDTSRNDDVTENSLTIASSSTTVRRRKSKSPNSKKSKSRSPKKVQIDKKPPHYLEISNDESKSIELNTSVVSSDYKAQQNGKSDDNDQTYIDEEIYDEVNFDKESLSDLLN